MKVLYKNKKVEGVCESEAKAKKFFGGKRNLADSLLSRVTALKQAESIKDIVVQPQFRFHKLNGKLDGFFAMDLTNKNCKWRIIIEPLQEDENKYTPCDIDKIATLVQVVRVEEVSKHYE